MVGCALLVHYPPKLAVSTLVNRLKAVSAHYLAIEFTGQIDQAFVDGHLWSPSYFAASCGGAPLKIIEDYIEAQKLPIQQRQRNGHSKDSRGLGDGPAQAAGSSANRMGRVVGRSEPPAGSTVRPRRTSSRRSATTGAVRPSSPRSSSPAGRTPSGFISHRA